MEKEEGSGNAAYNEAQPLNVDAARLFGAALLLAAPSVFRFYPYFLALILKTLP
ncbi:hypothetical protein [Hymenobacter gummosus]|uniref:hypothetical protein n=1 Tax=Hymenobacter gummosus TaxID=1776032 RepID=UPI001404AB35|nr:hypothetical protein [Hymenobacter gummosus]